MNSPQLPRRMALIVALLILSMVFAATAGAVEGPVDDSETSARLPAASNRLIVQLAAPSLVEFADSSEGAKLGLKMADGRLNLESPEAVDHISQLQVQQSDFLSTLEKAMPGARAASVFDSTGAQETLSYQVLLNAVAIEVSEVNESTLRRLSAMKGVRNVFRDYENKPAMYASLPLINAPDMWSMLGGQGMSGEGIIIASIDSGVYAPNPFFDPTGFEYPPGYPVGDTRYTTEKVIGARAYFRPWDPPTAGDEGAWPGANGSSHGTHTIGTAAGNADTEADVAGLTEIISGVAPRAQILSYKVFYPTNSQFSGSAFDAEIVMAFESAVLEGAHVINYSAGGYSGVMPWASATALARGAAWDAGVFVSHSAGNEGPGRSSAGDASPKVMEVAASTTSGTIAAGRFNVTAPEPVPSDLTDIPYASATFGAPLPIGQIVGPFDFVTSDAVDPDNFEGCDPWPAGTFTGKAAVISRGACEFGVKVVNAEEAGAEFVVVRNHATGGEGLVSMAPGSVGNQATISSIFVGYTNGLALVDWYATHVAASQFAVDTRGFQAGNVPDVIASFSSRGPAFARYLEPDVSAPGVNILSAGYGSGTGEARHMGFGQAGGTSMAAPHVAGSAALLKQMHPSWTPSQIMSALKSTSNTQVWLDEDQTVPATVMDMGAGRIDLAKAGDPGLTFEPSSLSFGAHQAGSAPTLTVMATDIRASGDARTYDLSVMVDAGVMASVSPSSLTFMGGETKSFEVMVDTSGADAGDYGGMVHIGHGPHINHIPLWVRVEAAPSDANVLLIDNDFSDLLGYPNYSSFYTGTLETLGVPYDYYNADLRFANPQTLPSAAELAPYDVIVYWSGDNYQSNGSFTVATPLTQIDMQVLSDWQYNGGRLLVSGQDLASAWDALDSSGDGYFLYSGNLGTGYLQDSIFDPGYAGLLPPVPAVVGQPGSPLSGLALDISGSAPITDVVDGEVVIVGWEDGAANQYFVDEVELAPFGDLGAPDAVYPILAAIDGAPVDAGFVGAARADRITLERSQLRFPYRSIYLSFGFEGINNNTGFNTREQVMGAALAWLTDEVEVTVTSPAQVANPFDLATFEAELTSSVGASVASCRWDFGDGSDIADGGTTAAYIYGDVGTYTVRVECVDTLGFSAVGETTIVVAEPSVMRSQRYDVMMDTFVDGARPNQVFGSASTMWVGFSNEMRPVVKTEITGIPFDAAIDQAYLYLYVLEGRGYPDWYNSVIDVSAHAVQTPWQEATASWFAPWMNPGGDLGPALDTLQIGQGRVGTWWRFDVTDAVAHIVAGDAENHGFALTSDYQVTPQEVVPEGLAAVRYGLATREHWDVSKVGYLRVMYRTYE